MNTLQRAGNGRAREFTCLHHVPPIAHEAGILTRNRWGGDHSRGSSYEEGGRLSPERKQGGCISTETRERGRDGMRQDGRKREKREEGGDTHLF